MSFFWRQKKKWIASFVLLEWNANDGRWKYINYSCLSGLRRQILAFPVTIATSGRWPSQNKAIKHFNWNRLEIPSMPSGERKPMFLNCTEHIQMDLKAKPYAKWTQEMKPFVSQIYFTLNNSSLEKECCFGKFVQVELFQISWKLFYISW